MRSCGCATSDWEQKGAWYDRQVQPTDGVPASQIAEAAREQAVDVEAAEMRWRCMQ
jgi:hypothetical protein